MIALNPLYFLLIRVSIFPLFFYFFIFISVYFSPVGWPVLVYLFIHKFLEQWNTNWCIFNIYYIYIYRHTHATCWFMNSSCSYVRVSKHALNGDCYHHRSIMSLNHSGHWSPKIVQYFLFQQHIGFTFYGWLEILISWMGMAVAFFSL